MSECARDIESGYSRRGAKSGSVLALSAGVSKARDLCLQDCIGTLIFLCMDEILGQTLVVNRSSVPTRTFESTPNHLARSVCAAYLRRALWPSSISPLSIIALNIHDLKQTANLPPTRGLLKRKSLGLAHTVMHRHGSNGQPSKYRWYKMWRT
jgi:hypothetical protein